MELNLNHAHLLALMFNRQMFNSLKTEWHSFEMFCLEMSQQHCGQRFHESASQFVEIIFHLNQDGILSVEWIVN